MDESEAIQSPEAAGLPPGVSSVAATQPDVPAQDRAPIPTLNELVTSISEAEQRLAETRNSLRRRASTERLSPAVAKAIAALAIEGEKRASTARRRYRNLEGTLNHKQPPFPLTERLDWRSGADAALKLALYNTGGQPVSLDEAIGILTPAELDSYAYLRRRSQREQTK